MDVDSLGDVSVSSSIERQAMREQLDTVRQTLNSLASGTVPNASGVNAAAPAGLDGVLTDIASKLANIEGIYSSLTNKLEKVDLRVEDSERHIKDLQHFSASTINETARLVDYVGNRTPGTRSGSQAGAGPSGVSAGAALRARNLAASGVPSTPPPPGMSPSRGSVQAMDYMPGHVSATIQQHAAQIHKLIAGLDFLEAHIIRQDQVVEGLQKQLLSVARDAAASSAVAESTTSPSEMSIRIHDMSELLNKLRTHMYKVERKTGNNDTALALLTQRIQTVELSGGRRQQQREAGESSELEGTLSPSILELATAQEELRNAVQDLCRDVLELRDQAQTARQASQPTVSAPPGLSAEEGADIRRQLSYLMSQVPTLLVEKKELQTAVASLQGQVAALEGRLQTAAPRADVEALSSALQAVKRQAAPVAELGSTLTTVSETVAAVQERVVALQDGLAERKEEAAAARVEVQALSAALTSRAEPVQPPAAASVDAVAKVNLITPGTPEAAVLAAQVSAAAKADLEEQFGQLRHRVEVAAAAAVAAEEAARSSAESAAVAAAALEAAGKGDDGAAANAGGALPQETVLAMVAGVKQEQAGLKQQLAQLAAHVSEEQAAISAGLLQVQEQVGVAAIAATEAAAAAQAVQEQQATGGQQEAEQLKVVQSELREQVASVLERLKERVEQGMQEMHAQLSTLSDRLGNAVTTTQLQAALRDGLDGAVTAERLDAALEQLRATAADSSERHELAAATLDELRAELILLTGQQDVTQSRLHGLESVVGVDARSSPLGRGTTTSLPPTIEEGDEEGEEDEEEQGGERGSEEGSGGCELRARLSALSVFPAVGLPGSRGLLDLVAELQSRVGGLEGALEAAAADMDQLRDLMQSDEGRTQDAIQQATAQLISDLQGLSAAVDERAASAAADLAALDAASTAMQQKVTDQASVNIGLAARMEEVQLRLESEVIARVQETSAAVSSLSARIARDYINREQLGAIFQARADMKRAVDELATVFSTGRLLRAVSADEDAANAEPEGGSPQSIGSGGGTLSPRLVSALEGLAGKQAELEHQVKLALYRTEGAVRQEQLAGVQQAMMTLELQFRRLGGTTAPAPSSAQQDPAQAGELSSLLARVEALEATLAAFGGSAPAATRQASDPGSALRVVLTPEDSDDSGTPIRLRLLVADQPAPQTHLFAGSTATTSAPILDIGGSGDSSGPDEEAGEPSLSSMLHGAAASSSPSTGFAAATTAADEQLQVVARALSGLMQQAEALRVEVAAEGAERQRLTEAVAELQEQLDMQVGATSSTAAMVATMVTDQPPRHVRLQVRVGASEAEADLAALTATVSTLTARLDAAEESLASAFVVRTPRSPTRSAAADGSACAPIGPASDGGEARQSEASANSEEEEDGEEVMRPALGMMVPVLPREVEQHIAALQAEARKVEAALGALAARVGGLEAADALEDMRAVASEAVLDAIPGLVSQQVAVVREEIDAIVSRQCELLDMAGQAARDAAEAVLAVREAAAEAAEARDAVAEGLTAVREAQEAAEAAAQEVAAQVASAREAAVEAAEARNVALAAAAEAEEAAAAAAATASAREGALDVAMSVAREVAEETAREAAARASLDALAPRDEELLGSVARLAVEVKDVRGAVGSLTERMNDVDALRDQLEVLAAQVRDSITASSAADGEADPAASSNTSNAQGPPSTPTAAVVAVANIFTPAATAVVIPPAHTPRGTVASPSPGGSRQAAAAATGSQQAAFLARLVAVVKRQSSRLHAQYRDAEETGMALAQVDSTLDEAEARLEDVRDVNSPAFAETLVTVLEQVAALRFIGSQTHPAVQQMVLEHENRLDKIAEELKALAGGSPIRADPRSAAAAAAATAAAAVSPALLEEVSSMSRQVCRLETELTRVAGQQVALDRAVKDMLAAVGSVRMGSVSGSSVGGATVSRRTSAHDGYAPEAGGVEAPLPDAAEAAAGAMGPAATAAATEDACCDGRSEASALEIAGLAAQVRLLEDTLEVQLRGLRQELMGEIRTRAGSGGGAAAVTAAGTAADLGALERTVSQLHSALTAIRNRLLAMQEYVDSTQGMIKDMHVGLGGLHRRVDTLEAASGPGSRSARVSGSGSADSGSFRELQVDLGKFERRLLVLESSSLEAAHALAGLKGLAPRVSEAETRLQDACSKLSVALGGTSSSSSSAPAIPAVAPGGSLPVVAGAVRALERRLGGRVDAACGALDSLAGALSAAGRIQAESTANPFKAISAAVNNPVIVAMEKKLESVRAEIQAAATSLSEDMRRDQQQSQLESRLATADASVRGGQ